MFESSRADKNINYIVLWFELHRITIIKKVEFVIWPKSGMFSIKKA